LRRAEPREDYGQADYSRDYGYDPATRTGYRTTERVEGRDDYGQVDYGDDYAYDPEARRGYRRDTEPYSRGYGGRSDGPPERGPEPRSFSDVRHRHGRRHASDRVIWTIVTQRLDNERGLDASAIDVFVDHGEVTLNGFVRDRDDKRRAEDLADLPDIRHVQNNLRIRESGWRRAFRF
jgi:hypothetical protein